MVNGLKTAQISGLHKVSNNKISLVDQVGEQLINYFRSQGLGCGSALPGEHELAEKLGVARTVVREALSRFKMLGIIDSKTKRGMIIKEPPLLVGVRLTVNPLWMSDAMLLDILELRCNLEIGCTHSLFHNITKQDIKELESIVNDDHAIDGNQYAPYDEYRFHSKLYQITGNKTINEFQDLIHPVMNFVKDKYKTFFEHTAVELEKNRTSVSHKQLFDLIKAGDESGYAKAIQQHFRLYTNYIDQQRSLSR